MDHRGEPRRASPSATLSMVRITVTALLLMVVLAGTVAAEDGNLPRYWEVHAALLSLATRLFVLSYGALVVKLIRRSIPELKWVKVAWLVKAHKVLGGLGAALGVAGISVGLYMVEMAGTGHARIPHALVGFTTLACVVIPVITGFAVGWVRKRKAAMRWWHIVLGLVGIVVMVLGAATGWALE